MATLSHSRGTLPHLQLNKLLFAVLFRGILSCSGAHSPRVIWVLPLHNHFLHALSRSVEYFCFSISYAGDVLHFHVCVLHLLLCLQCLRVPFPVFTKFFFTHIACIPATAYYPTLFEPHPKCIIQFFTTNTEHFPSTFTVWAA